MARRATRYFGLSSPRAGFAMDPELSTTIATDAPRPSSPAGAYFCDVAGDAVAVSGRSSLRTPQAPAATTSRATIALFVRRHVGPPKTFQPRMDSCTPSCLLPHYADEPAFVPGWTDRGGGEYRASARGRLHLAVANCPPVG